MRKKDESLYETILDLAKEMAQKTGPDSINMRRLSEKAGIATGTLYNYFSSKEDILLAITKDYWKKTLKEMGQSIISENFCDKLEESYEFLLERMSQEAGLLMASLSNVKTRGRKAMASFQENLVKTLIQYMEDDPTIKASVWDEDFTKEKYASFIIMNMMLLLQMKSPHMRFLIEIIKRTLY